MPKKKRINNTGALKNLPLWRIHRILADLSPTEQRKRIRLFAEAKHPYANDLIIEFGVPHE